jgi:hypothetical protein
VEFGPQKVAVRRSSNLTLYFPSDEQRHSVEVTAHQEDHVFLQEILFKLKKLFILVV